MGRPKKAGTSGAVTNYITRTRAVKKLRVSHPEFRKLCVFKGIYPRQPHRKLKGRDKSYYHLKDIRFLMHEPMINVFRSKKIHERRVKRAKAKKVGTKTLERMEEDEPFYNLDRIVLERYPTFGDALRDLDDCLSTISLFAALSADNRHLSPDVTMMCQRLINEFEIFVAHTHSLQKCFLSIKGVYLRAVVQGVPITWITPHNFVIQQDPDVDFKLLLTFVEFYTSLLTFVNYKLCSSSGIAYPPRIVGSSAGDMDEEDEDESTSTANLDIEYMDILGSVETLSSTDSIPVSEAAADRVKLFAPYTFYISRECPRPLLCMLIVSFGGKFVDDIEDPAITHIIADRPSAQKPSKHPEKSILITYAQPQWIVDCVNVMAILNSIRYEPGRQPPPHLSPFVDDSSEGYVPHRKLEIEAEIRGVSVDDVIAEREAIKGGNVLKGNSDRDDEDDESDDNDEPIPTDLLEMQQKPQMSSLEKELREEFSGSSLPAEKPIKQSKIRAKEQQEQKDRELMAKNMLSRRQQKLIEKQEKDEAVKDKEARLLNKKRKVVENASQAKQKAKRSK